MPDYVSSFFALYLRPSQIERLYCGPTCQRADWPNHKPSCKKVALQVYLSVSRLDLYLFLSQSDKRVAKKAKAKTKAKTKKAPLRAPQLDPELVNVVLAGVHHRFTTF